VQLEAGSSADHHGGAGNRLRCGHRRGRVLGVVHATQAAQRDGAHGAGLRGGERRRRDLVLEPLSGGEERFRQLHLLLLVRQGALA
ncbi:MAG: Cyclohexanone monooxygenase, partial [uncultured Rubrobacteraceae bacterium]